MDISGLFIVIDHITQFPKCREQFDFFCDPPSIRILANIHPLKLNDAGQSKERLELYNKLKVIK